MRGSFRHLEVRQGSSHPSRPGGDMTETLPVRGQAALILNVDGDAATRQAHTQALAAQGFRVREAANGGEALRQLAEAVPDLVLLSAQLPDMRAAELRRRIKRGPATAATMVLQFAVSAGPATDAADGCPADSYLAPLPAVPVLLASVRVLLRLRGAELALREAAIRKDEFLATLAHELRNPLAPMRTAIELMRMNSAVDDANAGTRETISRQIDQLVRLVDDLLDVSRITQGKLLLRKEFVEVRSIIDAAVENHAELLCSRGQQLTLRQPDERIWLRADSVRLAQALGNLLQNAAKYTQRGGHVELAVEVHDNRLQIAVADDGIGIAASHIGRIFELFAQAERLQDKAPEGLGVGLALVRHLVELHGGTIDAHSAGPGRGSVFTVNLPIDASLPMTARRARGGAHRMQGRIQPLRILLVDDSVDAVALLKMLLEKLGHEVAVANEGHAAIRLAAAFAPDVVLLDIGLPGLDGYQIAQRLKAMPALRQVPLVALTGYGQERDRERAFASGFSHHLVKPLDMDVLNDLLRRVKADPVPQP